MVVGTEPTDAVLTTPVTAADGRELAARTFPGVTGDVVVIAGATGVLQRFYTDLALAVRDRGPTVLTFDYRGVGGSRSVHPRRDDARMRDWGRLDLEAVLQHARGLAEDRVLWIGQSAGAVYLPLARSRHVPSRIVTVGALSGSWRLVTPRERLRLGLLWHTVFPVLRATVGYAPGRVYGGASLPPGVLDDWGRWCRHRDYLFGDPSVDTRGFADLTAPILAVRATDDPWSTEASHAAIHDRFSAAEVTRWDVSPADVGAPRIGHIDLLRRRVGGPVWPRLLDWLLARAPDVDPPPA
jgi:predicted alpha/beta hydrolase